jgi:hypothetical protein
MVKITTGCILVTSASTVRSAKNKLLLVSFFSVVSARLLKAKYYPNVVLTDTAFVKNAPPSCQGIKLLNEALCRGFSMTKEFVYGRIVVSER